MTLISDMFAATLPNASQIYPKRSEILYLVMFYLNTDLSWSRLTFDTTVNIHRTVIVLLL